jgi:NAD+-dependent secondary alcohol dehydrogenase Adh1
MKAQVLHCYDVGLTAATWLSYEDVPDPVLSKGSDVIVRIGGAAGVCWTNLHVIEGTWRLQMDPSGDARLPLILGHENAGWIEEVGPEVEGLKKGDPVILHPKISDALDLASGRGEDMQGAGAFPGLDRNGGFAEALMTSARNLILLPKFLQPSEAAPFANAGLTAYRTGKRAARKLLPGQTCVIIGAGGLGHIAIQIMRVMSAAEIIAVDCNDTSLQLAAECGADHLVKADGGEVDAVLSLTKGRGAEAVLDFVGNAGTTSKGLAMTRRPGNYYIVGYGEDIRVSTFDLVNNEKSIIGNPVGTWAELLELMELAHRGLVQLEIQEFDLVDANTTLRALLEGNIKGRAVLVP